MLPCNVSLLCKNVQCQDVFPGTWVDWKNKSARFIKQSEVSQAIFGIMIAAARQQIHGLVFLKSSDHKNRSFRCTFISQQGASGAERRPLSDKNTKIYKHVVLSHKVKEIWSYMGLGWGGVRELETFSQSKTQLKCWVYCLLHRNHLLCTAEHNNRDWLCVAAGQSNNCSSL